MVLINRKLLHVLPPVKLSLFKKEKWTELQFFNVDITDNILLVLVLLLFRLFTCTDYFVFRSANKILVPSMSLTSLLDSPN